MAKAAPDIEGEAGGHTPTPWRVYKTTNGRLLLGIGDADAGGITDAEFGLWRSEPERSANAAFIVKAVNSHEALVTALRDILDNTHVGKAGQIVTERSKYGNYPARCYHAARAALASAEAGNGR
jgi:hypothetical protein